MKKQLKTGLTAILLGTMIIQGGIPVLAADVPSSAVTSTSVNYGLTSDIRAAVKSIAVETTSQGLQISATVRLYNGGAVQNRIPEHELRVRGSNGLVYTLKPSASNKTSLQPKEISELVYMAVVDSKELAQIDEVSFVNVDEYSYPKVETNLLSIPVSNVWYGTGNASVQNQQLLSWGQAFTIPGVNSSLVFTPVEATVQSSASGRVAVVSVLAENPGLGRETVPAFRLDGQAGQKTYEGKQTDEGVLALEAGEKKYIHFAIPMETGVNLSNLLVVTTDTFVAGDSSKTVLATGKLGIKLPDGGQAIATPTASYTIGAPVAFDPLTKIIDNKTQVSLMELHLHENPESGYKTAVAKFKLTNLSDIPVALPDFQTELVSSNGVTYSGSRQASVASTMNPNLSYIVTYAFTLPQTETGEGVTLKLLDAVTAAPYATTIASLNTAVQAEETGDTFSVYPFDVKFNDVNIGYSSTINPLTYYYNVKLDLDVTQKDNVVVDDSFSKLRFEVVDNTGRVLGYVDRGFTGNDKLMTGKQELDTSNIQSEEYNFPLTVNVYELTTTSTGDAKRFITSFKE